MFPLDYFLWSYIIVYQTASMTPKDMKRRIIKG